MEKNTFFLITHHSNENLQNILSVGTLMEKNTLWKKNNFIIVHSTCKKLKNIISMNIFVEKVLWGEILCLNDFLYPHDLNKYSKCRILRKLKLICVNFEGNALGS